MLNEFFKQKFPLNFSYFKNLLELVDKNERNFPQALIFEGNDTISQYLFALELARNLNCKKNKDINCDCLNCKWIKTHSHPAINNVSQIHYKDKDDKTKTVISVKQARKIEHNLLLSSDYYRFFIFFSSSEKELDEEKKQYFKNLGYFDNINFSIEPLEYNTFNPATLNALLKSIEEPPKNVIFIFLTKTKANILPTIVSRCLTFKFPSKRIIKNNPELSEIFQNYFNINLENSFDFLNLFQKTMSEKNLDLKEILEEFLEFLSQILKNNLNNPNILNKIQNDIKIVNIALKQAQVGLSDKNILEGMFLKLARGY